MLVYITFVLNNINMLQCITIDFQLPSTDESFLDTLWGKLASEILMQDWDTALDDLTKLKDIIDNNVSLNKWKANIKFLQYRMVN